ncbi:hypothetical protein GmRootV213_38370 [Variovorax sp. V213]
MFARQRIQAEALDVERVVAVRDMRMSGERSVRHCLGAPLPVAPPAAGAGALLAAAGLGAASASEVARGPPGVSSCGRVARWAAAGSVGRKSGPR